MFKRGYKLIISVFLVTTLLFCCCSAFADAATPVWLLRAKSAVLATLLAMDLVTTPINVVLDAPLAESVDPLGTIPWVETLPEYLDRSVIKVLPDTVIIDGVEYSDIWLGPEAAEKLRLQGLDFATAYNILNNQDNITYADGVGYVYGVPIYTTDQILYPTRSQSVVMSSPGTYSFGDHINYTLEDRGSGSYPGSLNTYLDQSYLGNNTSSRPINFVSYIYANSSPVENSNYYIRVEGRGTSARNYNLGKVIDYAPFEFDYTSGVIDAPLSDGDGLLIRVPTQYSDPDSPSTVIYDIHDLININPSVTQPGGHEININPSLNPDFETDLDLGNGLGDLLLTIFGLDLLNKIINFAPEPISPDPQPQPGVIDPLPDPEPAPDDPVPGTTIANQDWTKLDELLRWIQSTIDSIRHITESLQTMLDTLFDQIQDIIQTLHDLPQQILEDIETGPAKVFRKALDILKSIFLPLLLPIKAMMNLWHYVIEWLSSVSAPFTWIFGVMSATSYNMVLPIYAALAGGICIAIYKALGR